MTANIVSWRIRELHKKTEYKLVRTRDDLVAVGRLRYRCYLKENAIIANCDGVLIDEFDRSPNAMIFSVLLDGHLAASIRLHLLKDKTSESPARHVFQDEMDNVLESGQTIIDPNRFVVCPSVDKSLEMAYLVLRLPFMASVYYGIDVATATVRSEHCAFYKRVLRYKQITSARPYPPLLKPLALMTADFQNERDAVLDRFPLFDSNLTERASLFTKADLQNFVKNTKSFGKALTASFVPFGDPNLSEAF